MRQQPHQFSTDQVAHRKKPDGGFLSRRPRITAHLGRLLLRVGDIHPHPGSKWQCAYCDKPVGKEYALWCFDCKKWLHRKCLRMTIKELLSHNNYSWHCGCERATGREPPKKQKPPVQAKKQKKLKTLQINIDGWRGKATILKNVLEDVEADVVTLQDAHREGRCADRLDPAQKRQNSPPLTGKRASPRWH